MSKEFINEVVSDILDQIERDNLNKYEVSLLMNTIHQFVIDAPLAEEQLQSEITDNTINDGEIDNYFDGCFHDDDDDVDLPMHILEDIATEGVNLNYL